MKYPRRQHADLITTFRETFRYQHDRLDPLVPDQPDQRQCGGRAVWRSGKWEYNGGTPYCGLPPDGHRAVWKMRWGWLDGDHAFGDCGSRRPVKAASKNPCHMRGNSSTEAGRGTSGCYVERPA
jgi:hypothetical protein